MVKDAMTNLRSHSEHDVDNSKTYVNSENSPCVKLFGVNIMEQITEENTTERVSLGDLPCPSSNFNGVSDLEYLSEEQFSCPQHKISRRIKKGKKWTEQEHLQFLAGIEEIGKGNWKHISENFVTTKTPTQIASHSQKYFLRLGSKYKRKPKSSVFNITLNKSAKAKEVCQDNSPPNPSTNTPSNSESQQVNTPVPQINQPQNVCMVYQPKFHQATHPSLVFQTMIGYAGTGHAPMGPGCFPIGMPSSSVMPPSSVMPMTSSTSSPMPLSWAMPPSSVMPITSSTSSPMPLSWAMPPSSVMPPSLVMPMPLSWVMPPSSSVIEASSST